MENTKFISRITLLSLLMIAPAALAWMPHASDLRNERTKSTLPFELGRQSIVVAENEPDTAESGGPSADENTDQAPDSKTADSEKSGNGSDDAATRPIKPFKPSEEIAAEQAVDFPVDI